MVRSENSQMQRTGLEHFLKWLWPVVIIAWIPVVLLLWWRLHEAQTFAQSLQLSRRLEYVGLFGTLWTIAGARCRAWLKKRRTS